MGADTGIVEVTDVVEVNGVVGRTEVVVRC